MNHTTNTVSTRTSGIARSLAAVAALTLFATACGGAAGGSETSSTDETGDVATTVADRATSDTDSSVVEQVDSGAGTGSEGAEPSPDRHQGATTGEVTIIGVVDFESSSGSFDVPAGADVLGCDGGSFVEAPLAAVVERVFTCESDGSGTFTVHFQPEMGEPGRFTSAWTVEDSTGDFAGLEGSGDFVGVMNDAETGGDGTWTGEITIGTADEASAAEAEAPSAAEASDDPQAFLTARVDRLKVPDDAGAVMAVIIDANGDAAAGVGGAHPDGAAPTPADPVRVGSITKVFTSLSTLALVDDGLVALDDPAAEHLTRVAVPDGVTVRDLLQHTSGIPSYTEVDSFFERVIEDPSRQWLPEEMVGVVADEDADFEPGEQFAYSNTNYAMLGILIEELTGRSLHEVVRERVIEPAGMSTTYLAGVEDGPAPVVAYTDFGDRTHSPIDFDYTAIATSAWSGGAMVSSAEDLHRMFTALYDGEIITDELRTEMTANEEYGLGIQPWNMEDTLVGHGGDIPGYHTLVFHAPDSGETAFWMSTSDRLVFHPLVEDTIHAMVPELATDDTD